MKRYVFMYGDQPWPARITTLQLYAPVDLSVNPELAELLPQWRAALDGAPVWLVEDAHLHVTLDMLSDAPAGEITSDERRALAASLRRAVAEFPVYQGRAGGCLSYSSGAVVDVSPAEPLRQLHLALRQAIHAVRGPDSTGYRVPKAHISLAFPTARRCTPPLTSKVAPRTCPRRAIGRLGVSRLRPLVLLHPLPVSA